MDGLIVQTTITKIESDIFLKFEFEPNSTKKLAQKGRVVSSHIYNVFFTISLMNVGFSTYNIE